jgi:hypothetical protein
MTRRQQARARTLREIRSLRKQLAELERRVAEWTAEEWANWNSENEHQMECRWDCCTTPG